MGVRLHQGADPGGAAVRVSSWWKKITGGASGQPGGPPSPPPPPEPERGGFNLEQMAHLERAVVFKHSRSCPVSWRADREVQQFSRLHPEVPVFKVVVQQDRDLSRRVADWTGVEHASPQVIVLRRGEVSSSESHEGVTAEFLDSAVK